MRNSNSFNNKGVSLIAAMAIMLIVAVLSVVLASMLGVTSRTSLDQLRSSQALALAQAGLNWYMMRLTGISDWTSENNLVDISLGTGTFDIAVTNKTSTRLDFTVTGKVTGTDGVTIKRTMSQRAWKLPSASKFALFWGRDVANLSFTNVSINGDFWSIGTTSIPSGSSVTQGTAYRPSTEDITGTGSYTEVNVGLPLPSTPTITPTYYTNLISTYNTAIAASPASSDLTQSSGTFTVSGTMRYRDVSITGTTTITGNGTLIANGSATARGVMTLGSTSGGPVTIRPDAGGSITFLARRSLTVNNVTISNTNNPAPDYYPRVRMYSRAAGGTSDRLTIQNTANLDRAFILCNRCILVRRSTTSPTITNSTLFVNYPGSATNNYLRVTGSGTSVGTMASPCSLISIGRANSNLASALTVDSGASVVGLLYQYDGANTGETDIATATITGSLIANRFDGNTISSLTLTYDPSVIPDPPPEGFNGFTTKKPNTWSGI